LLLLALAIAALSSACSGDASNPPVPVVGDTAAKNPNSSFTGPHAELIGGLWEDGDEWVRAALEDEVVSESEWQEAQDRLVACAASQGIKVFGFGPMGGHYVDWGDWEDAPYETKDPILQECTVTSGYFALEIALNATVRLPGGESEAAAMAECLVRSGVAPEGFSESDYLAELDLTQGVGLAMANQDSRVLQCLDHPTTAFRQ
jgi:hypothetical protein